MKITGMFPGRASLAGLPLDTSGLADGDIIVWDAASGSWVVSAPGATVGLSDATPQAESGAGDPGAGTLASRDDHVHPAVGGAGSDAMGSIVQTYNPASISSGGTATMGAAPTDGNLLIAFVTSNQYTVSSISQTNVTWTKVAAIYYPSGAYLIAEVWKGVVAASAGTGVTVNFTGNNAQAVTLVELSGLTAVDAAVATYSGAAGRVWGATLAWPVAGGRVMGFGYARGGNVTLVDPGSLWTLHAGEPASASGEMTMAYLADTTDVSAASFAVSGQTDNHGVLLIHAKP